MNALAPPGPESSAARLETRAQGACSEGGCDSSVRINANRGSRSHGCLMPKPRGNRARDSRAFHRASAGAHAAWR
eukprot:5121749-Pyramimonas_sp.AAC.1